MTGYYRRPEDSVSPLFIQDFGKALSFSVCQGPIYIGQGNFDAVGGDALCPGLVFLYPYIRIGGMDKFPVHADVASGIDAGVSESFA